MIAGNFPTPKMGIISASKASDGTVCRTLATPITKLEIFGKRVNKMPKGTATKIPSPSARAESTSVPRFLSAFDFRID